MSAVLRAERLGKRYRQRWAVRDCSLTLPEGGVIGLVGPNGAGKTTLLGLVTGMVQPTTGAIEVCGGRPGSGADQLGTVGYVAQDAPLYAHLRVREHLALGARLNAGWDEHLARRRVERVGLDPEQRAGTLSGGQRAQLALTLGLAKRPRLLVLDEPAASLDPLARRELLASLMEAVAEQELSVLFSSHVVSDLERVCDHLVVLVAAQVRVTGEVDALLERHVRLTGPRRDARSLTGSQRVVSERHTDRQSTFVVRTDEPVLDPAWTVGRLGVEDLVLAYLEGAPVPAVALAGGLAMTWLTWRQLRGQALAVAVLVGAVVVVLVLTGRPMHDLVARGPSAFDLLTTGDRALFYAGLAAVAVAPALLGLFWGAPLVAREVEAGTHRLIWNQGVTRARWLATKLAVTTTSAAVGVGALCLTVDWWAGPIDGALSRTRGGLPGRLTPIGFAMRGVVPVAYAVFAVVLGVAIGLVLRRTLPAMALTLALFVAIQVAVPVWVRPHLAPAVRATVGMTARPVDSLSLAADGQVSITLATGGRGDWVLTNRTVDAAGRATALPAWFATCTSPDPSSDASAGAASGADPQEAGTVDPCLSRLSDAGYRQKLVYQPASHFWRLQLTESALFLALSAALAGFCLLWLGRRDA